MAYFWEMPLPGVVLYDLGHFPAILEGDGSVYGELYDAPLDKIRELDRIEGYHQDDPER